MAICSATKKISIHALREEGDFDCLLVLAVRSLFLSTPSARRATLIVMRVPPRYSDFYPRPPRGGRQICFNGCISSY